MSAFTKSKPRWGRLAITWGVLIWVVYGLTQLMSCDVAHAEVNMDAIKTIESKGNARAYNKSSGARGAYQITAVCLKHYNQVHKKDYTLEELYKEPVSLAVASWYFTWLKDTYDFDDVEAIVGYNAGPKRALCYRAWTCDLPVETVNYLNKYQRLTAV